MSLTGTNERTMTYAEAAAKHPEVSRVAAIGKEAEERAEYAPRQRQEIIGVNATARILKGCVRLRARGMSPTETFQECGRIFDIEPRFVCCIVTDTNIAGDIERYLKKPEHVASFYRYFGHLY